MMESPAATPKSVLSATRRWSNQAQPERLNLTRTGSHRKLTRECSEYTCCDWADPGRPACLPVVMNVDAVGSRVGAGQTDQVQDHWKPALTEHGNIIPP